MNDGAGSIRTIKKRYGFLAFVVVAGLMSQFLGVALTAGTVSAATTAKVTDVATGASSACAVAGGQVKCWGEGSKGQLGNGSAKDSTNPVDVYAKTAWAETIPAKRECSLFGCKEIAEKKVRHEASPLGGKSVSKVSVGSSHVCALADAAVYCWGENNKGQLGNGKGGAFQQEAAPVAVIRSGASALKNKEIIDISAGDEFTCALASDGVVACWGEGDNGRLGTNATTDKNIPTAVYSQASSTKTEEMTVKGTGGASRKETRTVAIPASALYGKKSIKLAKASENTMCAIVVEGNAYCWGRGIDDGRNIPASDTVTVACGKDAPTSRPVNGNPRTIIFESAKPTLIPGATIASADGQSYITGLGTDGKSYYWGMYGYREDNTYSGIDRCVYNPCTDKIVGLQRSNESLTIVLAKPADMGARARDNARAGNRDNRGGGSALYNAQQYAKANGGVASGGMNNARVTLSNGAVVNFKANDSNNNGCNDEVHYGYVKKQTFTQVGQKVTTQPPSWPQSQSGIRASSGSVYDGLFCATVGAGVQCDGHGTKTTSGQLGNGNAAQLTGPQAVTQTGWLAGKSVTQLSTSSTGYTCAVATGTVGCWGVNTKGQLGTGDTKARNVPTVVGL